MKKIALTLTAAFFTIGMTMTLSAAEDGRLEGFGGQYFVPNYNFDILKINPAFLMRMEGFMIIDDNAFSIFYGSYKNVNTGVDSGTNIESENGGSTYDMVLTPRIGVLGTLTPSIGLGFVYEPQIIDYLQENYVKHDVTQPWTWDKRGDYLKRLTSGYLNFTVLAGLRLGSFDLGARGRFWKNPRLGEFVSSTTNGIVDPTTRTKTRLTDSGLGLKLGALTTMDGMELGAAASLDKIMVASSGGYYNKLADVYWAEDRTAWTKIGLILHFQKKLTEIWALRAVLSPNFNSASEDLIYDKENYDLAFGPGSYAASGLELQSGKTRENVTAVTLHASLFDSETCSGAQCLPLANSTRFMGITLGYLRDVTTYSPDNNKTADPTGPGQEYAQVSKSATPLLVGCAMGFENLFVDKIFLRGGFNAVLFKLMTTELKETDRWDAATSTLTDKVTSWNRSVDVFFLSSLVLTAGAGLKVNDRLLIDMGISIDLIGMNIDTAKSYPNLLPNAKHKAEATSLNFDAELNFSVSYKL
jgi:hypothetical protein